MWVSHVYNFFYGKKKKKKKKELAEVLTSEQPQKGLCRAFFVCLTYFVRYFSDINSSFRTSEINIRLDRMPKGKVPQKYLELLLLHFEKKKVFGAMVAAMAFLCRKQPHLHLIWSDPIFSRVGCCSRALQRNRDSVLSLNNQNIDHFQEVRIFRQNFILENIKNLTRF